jgi:hypothetical protein
MSMQELQTRGPRSVRTGPFRVTLHPPVLIYQGQRHEHITRPNLAQLDGAIAAIYQTTFDTSATPRDHRDIALSLDQGQTWQVVQRGLNLGSYAIAHTPRREAVVMPYDSIRFGATRDSLTGPCVTLRYRHGRLHVERDTVVANFPALLKGFLAEPILDDAGQPLYLDDDLPPADKPITAFWGAIHVLPDGRWLAPVYGCYESDPYARSSPAPEMRRLARFTSELCVSEDHGRTWRWYARLAAPGDVDPSCVEGPSEAHLYFFDSHWRAIFRSSALKGFFSPLHVCDSHDAGRTWSRPRPLPHLNAIMDPRGLQLPGGVTVLSAGRPKIELFLARHDSLDFQPVGLTEHHNAFLPRLRTTGHTDVIALSPRSLLVVYDSIPDSWRWPGSPFTAPDAVFAVRIDLDCEE